jgi:hypothetical protein
MRPRPWGSRNYRSNVGRYVAAEFHENAEVNALQHYIVAITSPLTRRSAAPLAIVFSSNAAIAAAIHSMSVYPKPLERKRSASALIGNPREGKDGPWRS